MHNAGMGQSVPQRPVLRILSPSNPTSQMPAAHKPDPPEDEVQDNNPGDESDEYDIQDEDEDEGGYTEDEDEEEGEEEGGGNLTAMLLGGTTSKPNLDEGDDDENADRGWTPDGKPAEDSEGEDADGDGVEDPSPDGPTEAQAPPKDKVSAGVKRGRDEDANEDNDGSSISADAKKTKI